jgi:hypothetical protein
MSSVEEVKAPPYRAPLPPVGWTVLWFGDTPVDKRGVPALVTTIESHGTIGLLITRPDGSRKTIRGAWYTKDPAFARADHYTRGARGHWDFLPGTYFDSRCPEDSPLAKLEARVATLELQLAPKPSTPSPASVEGFNLEESVLALDAQGLTAPQIAEKLETSQQRVSSILRIRKPKE